MTYEAYRYMFIGSTVMFVATLALAIFLYFKLEIMKTIGDLTGSTRRRALKLKEERGIDADSSGDLADAIEGTILPDLISGFVSGKKKPATKTEKLIADEIAELDSHANVTQSFSPFKRTTVLADKGVQPINATAVLANQSLPDADVYEVEYDITFVHTSEIIT